MKALSYRFQKKNQIGVPRFTHKAHLFFTPYKTCYNTRCFFLKKIVHFWDALKIGFLSEKFDQALHQIRPTKDQEGRGQGQKNVYAEECLTPAPPPSPGCDFKQKENKAKTQMLRAKYLSCSCSFDKHPPLGSCLPDPALPVGLKSGYLIGVVLNWGLILPRREHLAMAGDIFSC